MQLENFLRVLGILTWKMCAQSMALPWMQVQVKQGLQGLNQCQSFKIMRQRLSNPCLASYPVLLCSLVSLPLSFLGCTSPLCARIVYQLPPLLNRRLLPVPPAGALAGRTPVRCHAIFSVPSASSPIPLAHQILLRLLPAPIIPSSTSLHRRPPSQLPATSTLIRDYGSLKSLTLSEIDPSLKPPHSWPKMNN